MPEKDKTFRLLPSFLGLLGRRKWGENLVPPRQTEWKHSFELYFLFRIDRRSRFTGLEWENSVSSGWNRRRTIRTAIRVRRVPHTHRTNQIGLHIKRIARRFTEKGRTHSGETSQRDRRTEKETENVKRKCVP